jgi:subtilisin family serine protease
MNTKIIALMNTKKPLLSAHFRRQFRKDTIHLAALLGAAVLLAADLAPLATQIASVETPLAPQTAQAAPANAHQSTLAAGARQDAGTSGATSTTPAGTSTEGDGLAPSLTPLQQRLPAPIPGGDYTNYPYAALLAPNDPLYSQQWNLGRMNLSSAWNTTTGSSSTTIAIIDTGFALSHQDLTNRWWTNPGEIGPTVIEGPAPNCTSRGLVLDKSCNNFDNDSDGYKSNWRGWDFVNNDNDPQAGTVSPASTSAFHGTYVAGLTGAAGNNGAGVAGVNWGAKLMPLQVLGDDGIGYTTAIANAIRYAADHGAQVINMSLGSTYNDTYLRAQITYARSKGIVVVAAAGNDGCDCIAYPANYPEVVAVGASTLQDTRASFSSYGANLDIMAPGTDGICSTMWSAANPTSGYSCGGSGTSFSSPQVAGIVALVMGRYPAATPDRVSEILAENASKVSDMQGNIFTPSFGYGVANAYLAVIQGTQPIAFLDAQTQKGVEVVAVTSPELVTLCQATVGSTCQLQLAGPHGEVVSLSPQAVDRWGGAAVYWNSSSLGLSGGIWELQALNANGQPNGYHMSITIPN